MGRRDKDDLKWQKLKERVNKRDKRFCRLIRVLTAQECLKLKAKAPHCLLNRLDHAHCFGVGPYPDMCYIDSNVVLLNRYSHENLDNCRDPITGDPISREERDSWWVRILGEKVYKKLEDKAYSYESITTRAED